MYGTILYYTLPSYIILYYTILYETVKSESLKGKGKDVQVGISVETSKGENVKTFSQHHRLEEFTAQMVALKAFFMNEASNLKNEIEAITRKIK